MNNRIETKSTGYFYDTTSQSTHLRKMPKYTLTIDKVHTYNQKVHTYNWQSTHLQSKGTHLYT